MTLLITKGLFIEAENLLGEIETKEGASLYVMEQLANLIMNRDKVSFSALSPQLKTDLATYWNSHPYASMQSAMQAGVHNPGFYVLPALVPIGGENNKWDGSNSQSNETTTHQNTLVCFPNPTASNQGTIKGVIENTDAKNHQLVIYNSLGQAIFTSIIKSNQFQYQITLPSKGIYLVAISRDGEVIKQQKWIVQ